jgi:hypothetical protein
VINNFDRYPKDAGFDSRVMHGFFTSVKEIENIGLTNQQCKRSKICAPNEIPVDIFARLNACTHEKFWKKNNFFYLVK